MPFDQLEDFITPSELFYIRSHFPTPKAGSPRLSAIDQWRRAERAKPELRQISAPLAFTDLRRHAGMRRQQPGIHGATGAGPQWELGAVGNARMDGCSPVPCFWSAPG